MVHILVLVNRYPLDNTVLMDRRCQILSFSVLDEINIVGQRSTSRRYGTTRSVAQRDLRILVLSVYRQDTSLILDQVLQRNTVVISLLGCVKPIFLSVILIRYRMNVDVYIVVLRRILEQELILIFQLRCQTESVRISPILTFLICCLIPVIPLSNPLIGQEMNTTLVRISRIHTQISLFILLTYPQVRNLNVNAIHVRTAISTSGLGIEALRIERIRDIGSQYILIECQLQAMIRFLIRTENRIQLISGQENLGRAHQ